MLKIQNIYFMVLLVQVRKGIEMGENVKWVRLNKNQKLQEPGKNNYYKTEEPQNMEWNWRGEYFEGYTEKKKGERINITKIVLFIALH